MMHNMHPGLKSGAAMQHYHNVTPFLNCFHLGQDGQKELYIMMFMMVNWLKPVYLRLLLLIG